MTRTYRFRTEFQGVRQVVPVEARSISEARSILADTIWPGERVLF